MMRPKAQLEDNSPVIVPEGNHPPVKLPGECADYLRSHPVQDRAVAQWYGRAMVLLVLAAARRISSNGGHSEMTKRLDQFYIPFAKRSVSAAFESGIEEALDMMRGVEPTEAMNRIYESLLAEPGL